MGRRKNTIRNMIWGTINRLISTVVPFITRTIIINQLGNEYLGLNSLFSSILQILNLTELGVSSAIVYFMYKPIAEKDEEKICSLLNLYKKIYRVIGSIILVIGLCLLPFLNNLISGDVPDDINIYILYLIYLFNTVCTYWLFAYKQSLLQAFQRNDLVSKVHSILYIVQSALQMIVVLVFKNYYLYVIVMPIITIATNICNAIIAKKKYPKYIPKGKVSEKLKKELKKKVSGLMIYKICTTTRNSLDSIFISAFLGLNAVAIYNNYYMIMSSIVTFMAIITNSMTSGIGNSVATETPKKNYNDMNKFNFMYMLIVGWCSICLLCLYQPFMKLWVGEEYILGFDCVILLVLYFYALGIGSIRAMYSDAAGLWWESRYRALAETFANIGLNFILGKIFGLQGIIAATLISLLVINFGYGSTIIYKYYFKEEKVSEYYLYHLKYFIITVIIATITYLICNFIHVDGITQLIYNGVVCIIIPTILYYFIYKKNKYFDETKIMLQEILKMK